MIEIQEKTPSFVQLSETLRFLLIENFLFFEELNRLITLPLNPQCEIDMYMRRKCQACRLKKCYTVGMRAECVVPESQCQKKREAKKASQKRNNSGDSTEGGNSGMGGLAAAGGGTSTAMSPTGMSQVRGLRLCTNTSLGSVH